MAATSSGRYRSGLKTGGMPVAALCLLDRASVGSDETIPSAIERLERDYMVTIVAVDVPERASDALD